MHPGVDWPKFQQRLSDLRVAVDEGQSRGANLQAQLDAVMLSLQSKHAESALLQLQLAEARSSLDLIQASWQGEDLAEVQVRGGRRHAFSWAL